MSTRLRLTTPVDSRDLHDYWLRIEGRSGMLALVGGEDVESPWLRAQCSCGWSSAHKFTIEDNAHSEWITHATGET